MAGIYSIPTLTKAERDNRQKCECVYFSNTLILRLCLHVCTLKVHLSHLLSLLTCKQVAPNSSSCWVTLLFVIDCGLDRGWEKSRQMM